MGLLQIALVFASLAAPGDLPRAADTVLLLNLQSLGIANSDAMVFTFRIADLIGAHGRLKVISADEVNEMIAYQRALRFLGCSDDACIAELSRVANARLVLSGSVGKVGDDFVLNLSLTDAELTRAVGSATRQAADEAELSDQLPGAVAEVFGWEDAPPAAARYRMPDGEQVSLAVFGLKALGLADSVAQNLSQILAIELKRIDGTQVISREDVASMLNLQSTKNMVDCELDLACLAEIGGALGVQKLVAGHVGVLAEQRVVSLRLIDVRRSVVDARVSETFSGGDEQLMPALRVAAWRLLGIEPSEPGVLALSGSEAEASVFLDGERVGSLPLRPLRGLFPGKHTVQISKAGFFDWRSDVYVEPNGTTPVWADVLAEPPPFYQTWWFWTVIGALAVGGAVTATVVTVTSTSDTVTLTGTFP